MKEIINNPKNQFFFKHNYENIEERKIVNRSSGIFYFICSEDTKTELHFLNYWKEKRSLADVILRLTFRTMKGEILERTEEKIKAIGSHVKCIKSILKSLNIFQKEGSVEMEFLSTDDMVISYPAVIVRYIGKNWHTTAHTSQRIFSETSGDAEELLNGEFLNAEEGNIAIPNLDCAPFFIIHNGPLELPSQDIEHKIIRSDGETKSFLQKNIKFKPYETKIIRPIKEFDCHSFIENKLSTFTIKFFTTGIFSRLIAGFEREKSWSIDHTNFASISGSSANDIFQANKDKNFRNLVFNLPIQPSWNNSALFPPSYPENRSYKITMNEIDKEGNSINNSQIICGRKIGEELFPKFDFYKKNSNTNPEFIISNNDELPKRFHMVITYQTGNGLPGFIVDGPIHHSTTGIRTRWLPIFNDDCENYIIISNRLIGAEKPRDIKFKTKLFNSFNKEPIETNITIKAFESISFHISDIFPEWKISLKNKPGWLYLISENKQRCNIHYASLMGESIACDHAF